MKWWAENIRTVEIALKTDTERGITANEARERLKKHGQNSIEGKRPVEPIRIFINQFRDPLIYVLIAAAAISAVVGEAMDFALITTILILNGIFGFIQEYKAEKAIESLRKMATPTAKVIRDGKTIEVAATDLVPGDVVIISEGDIVPADLRIFEAHGLSIDESMLTGESIPVEKTKEALPEKIILPERKNMAFMGTHVVRGHGKGIVVATGRSTEMGRIAHEIRKDEDKKTHLEDELEHLGSFITKTVVGIAAAIAILLLARNPTLDGLITAVMTSISLAVAAVPEGLPAVVTIALALGVKRMAKRNALVRRLKSVETLGSVDVICTDKTGTLTENKMQVVEAWGNEQKMAEVGFFCHSLDENSKGDPTEIAIVDWAKKISDFSGKKVAEIPFDSGRKRMTVIVERDEKRYVYMKGAPEIVLSLCSLGPDERKKIEKEANRMAERGLRVLAMAWKEFEGGEPEGDLQFAGLIGLWDPPRRDAIEAMKLAMSAGIKVIMITGDHAKTAEAIGGEFGLGGRIVTGEELEEMDDAELDEIIEDVAIFARVSPEHKVRIVESLRRRGHIVAMTGDGVNDAVALKRADIGVAMGSGTEVAKEAADMILLNDSFATIVAAIEEGRRIFHNIRSFVIYLLSANTAEVVAIFTGSILNHIILKPVQILWMNLLTDGPPALAISADPAPGNVMKQPPRRRGTGILSDRDKKLRIYLFGMILGLAILAIYILNAHDPELARGAVLTGFVVLELVRLDVVRDVPLWKNRALVATILGIFLLQLVVLYTPFSAVLGVKPLTLQDWGEIAGIAAAIYLAARVLKI